MSIKDSIYSSPEALRNLYLNPRNPNREADQAITSPTAGSEDPPPTAPPPDVPYQPPQCPAVGQLVWVKASERNFKAKFVQDVQVGVDYLFNPITRSFHLVVFANIIKAREVLRVKTVCGAEGIFTLSHPILYELDQTDGKAFHNFKVGDKIATWNLDKPPKMSRGKIIDFSAVELIEFVGVSDVVHISLADGFIYAAGSFDTKMILSHNKPPSGGGGGEIGNQGELQE